jgi:hypothetical protein
MKKGTGILVYDYRQERYDIRFGLEEYYGGLHCGDCFNVKINKEWVPTRIELRWSNKAWYLVGIDKNISLDGLMVRL